MQTTFGIDKGSGEGCVEVGLLSENVLDRPKWQGRVRRVLSLAVKH